MIQQIKAPVLDELNRFHDKMDSLLNVDIPLLKEITSYISQSKGKEMRPLLVLLSAAACGAITPKTYSVALAIEFLHMSSLLHDDVIDESRLRRSQTTVNAKWGDKLAILVGDYLLAIGVSELSSTGDAQVVSSVSGLGAEMAKGELLQINVSKQHIFDEKAYYEVISSKTARTFAIASFGGALSCGASDYLSAMSDFGYNIGMAFQIRDDIFDYSDDPTIGKPFAKDLPEGKVTLPLLAVLSRPGGERIKAIIEHRDFTPENVQNCYRFAVENGGIEYATRRMDEFYETAIAALDTLPNTPYKEALVDFARLVVSREH